MSKAKNPLRSQIQREIITGSNPAESADVHDFLKDFFDTFNQLEIEGIDLSTQESAQRSLEYLKLKQAAIEAKMKNVSALKKLIEQ